MSNCIIYHSYSGITRGVAEKIQAECGGDLIEARPLEKYTTLTAYTVGCMRARNENCDPIEPESIDVSSFDLIVIGTPVWAWKSTPVANAAVAALKGAEGKKGVIFATCGSQAGDTLAILKNALHAKGVDVIGEMTFTRFDLKSAEKINRLTEMIRSAGQAGRS